jgi:biotin carboxyl carrier protein
MSERSMPENKTRSSGSGEIRMKRGVPMKPKHRSRHELRVLIFCSALLFFFDAPLLARDNSDVMVMKNGDRMTCQIKGLDAGVLYVSFDYIDGTASVDWSKVARLESKQLFIVKTQDGSMYTGRLTTMETAAGRPVKIQVVETPEKEITIERSQVVQVVQTSENFWQRFSGEVGWGIIYSKGNQSTHYDLSSETAYIRERWNAKANLVAARANLEKAKAGLIQTKADYDRAVRLTNDGVTSLQQLDLAKANYDSATATVNASDANITQAAAQVSQKQAAVTVAQTNLDYTVIRSPIDGTVVARNVDVGQTVAASLQAPTIFTIAQDLKKMWVYAKTDESDVGNIKISKPVTFKVDAFPKDTFHGVVSQLRMNATTVQSVVTYDTIIEFANPELKLFPGMTAYVTIPVATVQNALKLPNTALRYKPPLAAEQVLAHLDRTTIEKETAR